MIANSEGEEEHSKVQDKLNPEEDEDEDEGDLVPSAYPARKKAERQAANNKKALKEAEVSHTCDT